MKNVRSKSVQSRYFILSVVLILCMLIGMINGVPFLSQASGHEEQLASKNVMAKITLDGKNPPAGKFQFELVDSNGSVVDRTTNDAGGNIIFKGHELEVKEAKYTIRLVDGDKNINYGETTKNVNVYLKDGEEIVDPYDDAVSFRAREVKTGAYDQKIFVDYTINGKSSSTQAFCINTDVALAAGTNMIPIKDPDDATLAKYIVPRIYDWKAIYAEAHKKDKLNIISLPGFVKVTLQRARYNFSRYAYGTATNSIASEIRHTFGTNSISDLLRKTLYYTTENNFSLDGIQVDRISGARKIAADNYINNAKTGKYNDFDYTYHLKQAMVWAVTGGIWGTRRAHYRYDIERKNGTIEEMFPNEQDAVIPANFKSHMQKIARQNFNIPDNYHIMIFTTPGNTSQPLAFGYFNDGQTKRRVKKTWLNVPNFECKSQKSVEVTKNWIGNIKADSVNVTLKTTDGNVVESKRITREDGWKATFGPYDKYDASGKEVKYNIDETKVDGYNSTITGDDNNGFVITNTETTKIKVVKKWFGKIADSITLVLKDAKTNKVIEERKINKSDLPNGNSDTWEITFEAPKYDSSKNEIKYTVDEAKMNGYTIKALCDDTNGHTIINIERKELKVIKKWIGPVGSEIYINVRNSANNELIKKVKVDENYKGLQKLIDKKNNITTWIIPIEVDKYTDTGAEISYEVEEVKMPNYVGTVEKDTDDQFTIVNVPSVSFGGKKNWVNREGKPGQVGNRIIVHLMKEGSTQPVETKVLNKSEYVGKTTWDFTFKPVPLYDDNGREIKYYVEEEAVQGYEKAVITKDSAGNFVINNKEEHKNEKINIKVTKKWLNNNGEAGIPAGPIEIALKNGSKVVQKQTINLGADKSVWEFTFNDVDKYDDKNQLINYSVTETALDGYETEITGNQDNGFVITNKKLPEPKEKIKIIKKWIGRVGDSITITIKNANTKEVLDKVTVTRNTKGFVEKKDPSQPNVTIWEVPYEVNKFDASRTPIEYSAEETALEGYNTTVSKDSNTQFTITNTEKVKVKVYKTWVGEAATNATIQLLNGTLPYATKTIDESFAKRPNTWEVTFEAPKYDTQGRKIDYTVTETAISGYIAKVIKANDGSFTIVNTKTKKEKYKIVKNWIGKEGDQITVRFKDKATGKELFVKTIHRNDPDLNRITYQATPSYVTWEVFVDLDKYGVNGDSITYTVDEDPIPGYNTYIYKPGVETDKYGYICDRYIIENRETVAYKVTKKWFGKIGNDITVELKNGEQVIETKTMSKADLKAGTNNEWEVTFAPVEKYDRWGNAIKYSVEEVTSPGSGYTNTVIDHKDGNITIINTENTEIIVNKRWIRKVGHEVKLKLMNGEKVVEEQTLNAPPVKNAKGWETKFIVPKYDENGNLIHYTVTEVAIRGYKAEVVGDAKNGFTITNTNDEKVKVKVNKKWLGKIGDKVTLSLMEGTRVVETKTIDASSAKEGDPSTWEVSFEAPMYSLNGSRALYTVTEAAIEGYKADISGTKSEGFTITNISTEKIKIKVDKKWLGKVGSQITLKLMDGTDVVDTKTVDASAAKDGDPNTWEVEFEARKFDDTGREIVYTVKEETVPGYETKVSGNQKDGFTIANRDTEKIKIKVDKKWIGKAASEISISLMDGSKVVSTKRVNDTFAKAGAVNTWAVTFEADKYDENGKEIAYTVTESAIAGYDAKVSGNKKDGFTITNTNTEKVKIKVDKKWLGKVGSQITVALLDGTKVVDRKTVDTSAAKDGDAKTWEVSFEAPKYSEDGREVVYAVTESAIAGYKAEVRGDQATGFTILNKDTEKVKINVNKKWLGKVGSQITVKLMNGTKVVDTKTVDASAAKDGDGKTWELSFDADKYDEAGNEITYTVAEEAVPGYETKVSGNQKDGFTITNKDTEKVKIKVDKKWLGKVANEITVSLMNGTKVVGTKTVNSTFAKSGDAKTWEVIFEADKYDNTGKEIAYTVTESAIAGYKASVSGNQSAGFTITNKDTEKVKIKVDKKWLGKVGSQITVSLMNGTKVVDTKTVDAAAAKDGDGKTWELSFDADKYDEAGNEITYTVTEEAVAGYETKVSGNQISGFTITNKDTEKVKIKVDKKWLGKVGNEITVKLMNGTKVVGEKTVNASAAKDGDAKTWEVSFEADKYDEAGKEIAYTVTESAIAGYEASVSGTAKTGFTLINKDTEKVKIKVDKKWLGGVADQVTISLMNGTIPYATKTINASAAKSGDAKTWEVTFEAPKYNALGEEIAYTVTEAAVSGYKAAVSGDQKNGFTITNTQTGTEKFKVIKRWIGAEGDKITVRIKDADTGAELLVRTINKTDADLKRITDPSNPNVTIWEVPVELDKFDSVGRKITYSVDEEKLPNYGKTIVKSSEGFTITNTEEVSFKVTKKWLGQVGNEITLTLKSGDKVLETKKVTSADLKTGTNDTWEVTFKAVPKYDSLGHMINYTVDEQDVANYEKNVVNNNNGSFTITNTEKTVIRVDKKWLGKVANEVTVKLMNGTEVVGEKTINASAAKSGDATTWEVSFEAPKYGKDGKEIAYTVTESAIAGYEASVSGNKNEGFTITNKDTEKVKIRVDKKWLGKVGEKVTLSLMNGSEVVDTKTVDAAAAKAGEANTWEVSFEAPKYGKDGKEVTYTVTESAIAGYKAEVSGNQAAGFTVTNASTEKVKIKVDKKWLGKVADSVTVKLMNGTQVVEEKTVAKTGEEKTWELSFEAPKYDAAGKEIAYTVTESAIAGYKAELSGSQSAGFVITNRDTEKVKIKVDKKWLGKVADSVTVKLMNGTQVVEEKTVAKSGDAKTWELSFEAPKYDEAGNEIAYTVTESAIAGYKAEVSGSQSAGFVITNRDTEKVKINVNKKWLGKVADSVTVKLMNGAQVVEEKTVAKSGDSKTWELSFEAPKYDEAGNEIAYTVTESAIAGYKAEVSGSQSAGFVITNKDTEKVKINVNKKWLGKVGDRITLKLMNGSQVVEEKTVDATSAKANDAKTWEVSFEADKYDAEGNEITYTVVESAVAGYDTSVSGNQKTGFTIINKDTEKVKIKVDKKWLGGVADQVTISLMNGTIPYATKTINASAAKSGDAKTWEVTFEAPKYNALGEEIAYTVTEAAVSGYKAAVSGDQKNGFTITNTQTGTEKFKVIKRWIGAEGDKITVRIKDADTGAELLVRTINKTDADLVRITDPSNPNVTIWEVPVELDKFDSVGRKITYSVDEENVPNYGKTIVNSENNFVITNTEEVSFKVTKKWLGKVGNEVTVSLKSGDKVLETKKLTSADLKAGTNNTWETTFKAVPKYDSLGHIINYTVDEQNVDGYVKEITNNNNGSFTIINNEKTQIRVDKKWLGKVAGSVTIKLMNGTEVVEEKTVAKSGDAKTWEVSFEAPKYGKDGNAIAYTVTEAAIAGYKAEVSGNQKDGFVITNKDTEKVKIRVDKKWLGKVGSEITVKLMNGTEVVDTKTVDASAAKIGNAKTWEVSFEAPKYGKDGNEVVYTVTESAIEGYKAEVSGNQDAGFTITNKDTEKVKIKVDKKWLGKVANQITISLMNGTEVVEEKTVDATSAKQDDAKTWEVTFEAPKYDANGEEIAYTVKESAIAGYESNVSGNQKDGFTITNRDTEKVKIKVDKKWLGKVANHITVSLMNGNRVVESKTVNASAAKAGDASTWEVSFDAAKYDEAGKEIAYTVTESAIAGYEAKVSGNQAEGFTITNKDTEKVKVKVDKKWLGKAANQITVSLMNGTEVVATKTVDAAYAKNGDAKTWEVEFEAPKYGNDGKEAAYTVTESAIAGYTAEVSGNQATGFTITNRDNEKVKINVDKKWLGKVANEITVSLMNGTKVVESKTVNASAAKSGEAKTWEVSFEAPKYDAAGNEIAYTVTESAIAGYEAKVSGNQATGFTIVNKDTEKVKIKVDKKWLGGVADQVTISLMNGNVPYATKTVDASAAKSGDAKTWEVTFEAPKYNALGEEIAYTVTESAVTGYKAAVSGNQNNGFTITNTQTGTEKFKVIKKWIGAEGDKITVRIKDADTGAELLVRTINKTDADLVRITDPANPNVTIWEVPVELDKFDSVGRKITYSVDEENVPNYGKTIVSSENNFVITNTEEVSFKVDKKWVGQVGSEITVVLKSGERVLETKKVTSADLKAGTNDTWEVTFKPVPKYDAFGHLINYTVDEQNAANYVKEVTNNNDGSFTITNTEKTVIRVDKKWLGKVASGVAIKLMNGSQVVDEKTVNASAAKSGDASTWEVSFEAPKYGKDGKAIVYTVTEAAIAGYEAEVSGNQAEGFTITNKDTEKVKIKVDKKWLGKAANQITVALMNGTEIVESKTVDATAVKAGEANTWEVSFEAPKYGKDGKAVVYTVTESAIAGYEAAVSGNQEAGFTITNTNTEKVKVKVDKKWLGKVANQITVSLMNGTNVVESKTVDATSAKNGDAKTWELAFEAPKYDAAGNEIAYTVTESAIAGYEAAVSGNQNNGFTITNKDTEKVKIKVDKKWLGGVADQVTISLMNGSIPYATKTVDASAAKSGDDKTWEVTFEAPKYNALGEEIVYTVTESAISGYKAAVSGDQTNGFTITNTQTGTEKFKVIKRWIGAEGDKITVRIKDADTGAELLVRTITKTDADLVRITDPANPNVTVWEVPVELDKFDSVGRKITYSVDEENVPNYGKTIVSSENNFVITNTEEVSYKVDKKWIGQVGNEITVVLKSGDKIVETKKVTSADLKANTNDTWEVTFKPVPKYDAFGHLINYTVDEENVANYNKEITDNHDGSFTITNTEKVKVKVDKKWIGKVGNQITVSLMDGTNVVETKTVDAASAKSDDANTWEVSFEAPKYGKDGRVVAYTVTESAIAGYTAEVSGSQDTGFTITNTSDEKVKIKVDKKWLGKVGNQITLSLMNGETVVDTKTVDATSAKANDAKTWEVSFEAPKYGKDGKAVVYTVTESAIEGYTAEVSGNQDAGFTVTNTSNEKVKIKVDKKWLGKVAEKVTLSLMNGANVVDTKTVDAASAKANDAKTWEVSFEAPKYDAAGNEIAYTVTESAIAGYEASVSGNQNDGFTVINKDTEKVKIKVDKKWLGKVANEITLTLMNGDIPYATKTVNASAAKANEANTWEATFEAPKYNAAGEEIVYTVTESAIAGYTAKVSGNQKDGFTITNTESGKKIFKITKKWIGAEGDKITVRIKDANSGAELYVRTIYKTDADLKRITDPANPNVTVWEVPVELDAFDSEGRVITYSVDEENVPNYGKSIVDTESGVTITNTELVSYKVLKKWIGKVGDEITVSFKLGDTVLETKTITGAALVAGTEDTWEVSFSPVPKYDEFGHEIKYTVDEQDVANYEKQIINNNDGSFTIINRENPTPNDEKVVIKVNKQWVGKVSDEITVFLMNGTDIVQAQTVNASAAKDGDQNNWEFSFEAPKYDAEGKEIVYTVMEKALDGYLTEITGNQKDGFVITNTENPTPHDEKITIKVDKKWLGKVADEITVYLMNGASVVEEKTVNASAAKDGDENTWELTFEAPKYDKDGNEITYTVAEAALAGYTTEIVGNQNDGFVITNKENPTPNDEKVTIKVDKKWLGKVGDKITVSLMNGTQIVQVKTVDASAAVNGDQNTWELTFEAPKYDADGNEITYTVAEAELEGYTTEISGNQKDGFVITNTEKPNDEKIKIRVDKRWLGKVAGEITVSVLKGDIPYATKTVTASAIKNGDLNTWETTFDDLPKYDTAGNEIAYTVTESAISGYSTTVEGDQNLGFTITNTETGCEHFKVIKKWVGAEGDKITIRIKDAETGKELYVRTVYKTDADITRKYLFDNQNIIVWEIPVDLDRFDSKGRKITYSVDEENIPNYGKTIGDVECGGVTITNTEMVSYKVTKKWYGKVGDEIIVSLKRGDAILETKTVTASALKAGTTNTWEVAFGTYPKYDGLGHEIKYTVDEQDVANYTKQVIDNNDGNITITNSENGIVKVTKKWDGAVGAFITLNIKDGDKVVATRVVTKAAVASGDATTWTTEFALPKYDETGKVIDYSVDEEDISGYTKTITGNTQDGFVVLNKEKPYTPDIPVIPPTPVYPDPQIPQVPQDPQNPDPFEPQVPVNPDPTPKGVPTRPAVSTPDPKKPNNPGDVVTIDDGDTPKGSVVKGKKPKGKNTNIEVGDDNPPKGLPKTGSTDDMVFYANGCVLLLLAGLMMFKKKENE